MSAGLLLNSDCIYLIVGFLGRKAKYLLRSLNRDFCYNIVPRTLVTVRVRALCLDEAGALRFVVNTLTLSKAIRKLELSELTLSKGATATL